MADLPCAAPPKEGAKYSASGMANGHSTFLPAQPHLSAGRCPCPPPPESPWAAGQGPRRLRGAAPRAGPESDPDRGSRPPTAAPSAPASTTESCRHTADRHRPPEAFARALASPPPQPPPLASLPNRAALPQPPCGVDPEHAPPGLGETAVGSLRRLKKGRSPDEAAAQRLRSARRWQPTLLGKRLDRFGSTAAYVPRGRLAVSARYRIQRSL